MYAPGEAIPEGHVELRKMPDPKCRECGGKGRHMKKRPGKRGGFYYQPCGCTQ